jgi:hypothetical protein
VPHGRTGLDQPQHQGQTLNNRPPAHFVVMAGLGPAICVCTCLTRRERGIADFSGGQHMPGAVIRQ